MTACVVGSGPAGIACAHALLERGVRVLMLDVGLGLSVERRRMVDALRNETPHEWSPSVLSILKGKMAPDRKGVPLKLSWGSDYPYAETEKLIPWHADGVSTRPSLAAGGLSNVWGAAMLPYHQRDIPDWPVTIAQLAPHYEAVTALTGLAATHDDLEGDFPLYARSPRHFPPSRQAQLLLGNLAENRAALARAGWTFGRSRLAVTAVDADGRRGCALCGMCMYGCAYDCIYSSALTLQSLKAHPKFTYRPGVVVRRLREEGDTVYIDAIDRTSGNPIVIDASRVFLGAGVVPTAQILLRSLEAYDQPVLLLDSQYFLVPLLLARGPRDVAGESVNALSQLFIELKHDRASRHTVHLQVYSYNDLIGATLRNSFGPLGNALGGLRTRLEDRMLIIQGYIHSDESSSIEMVLRRAAEATSGDRLHLSARINPVTAPTIGRVLSELLRRARQMGAAVITPMRQIPEPGRGFHTGGSFPMRDEPAALETDVLGRPHSWKRIHVVDASVLPSIPATTITFTVMANAHRIGATSAKLA